MVELGTGLARLACAVLALACAASAAQEPRDPRARWERMPHEERAKLAERFEAFRALPPEERAKLVERAQRLEHLRGELLTSLPAELRVRLERMTPLERVETLREFVERRLRERARHVRAFLPRALRERIEDAPPRARERLLRDFCDRTRREDGRRMLRALARRLELPDEETARVEALPEPQRFEALMDLRRRSIEADVAAEGLPAWLDAAEWDAMTALGTREFFERFHELRRDRCGADHDGGPGGPRFGPTQRGERGAGWREWLAPDPAWRDELGELPPQDRDARLQAKLRERVLARLAERPDLISAEELEALRAKPGAEFQNALRDALRAAVRGAHREGGGSPGAPEQAEGR